MAGTERGKTLFEQRIKGSLPTPFMGQERHYTHKKAPWGSKVQGQHQPRGVLLLPEAFTSRSILAEGYMSTQRRVLTNQPGRGRAKQYDWPAAATAKSLQSCPTLCDPIDSSPPGSPVPGILQARILEWVAISFSNTWKWKMKVAQSCPTFSDPMDYSLPGSSIHGIFQARVLEWGAIAFSDDWPKRWQKTQKTATL